MEPLHWTFILTALTLIFVFAAANPLQLATEEAVKTNARLQALQIASTINLLSTAPDKTTYIIDMPDARCTLRITPALVYLKIKSTSDQELAEAVSIIQTDLKITEKSFECRETKALRLVKDKGMLEIGAA